MRRFLALVWTLGAGALLVSGCFVEPAYNGKKVACNSNADCKSLGSGYTCQPEGFCARPGDGGTVSDGGAGDGGLGDGGMGDGGATDGGGPTCSPGCVTGQTCTTNGCVATADLKVTITSPADEAMVGDVSTVHATVTGFVGRITSVTCTVGTAAPVAATATPTDWSCKADLTATAQGATTKVTVKATDAKSRTNSAVVHLIHDTQPPTLTINHPQQADGFYLQAPGDLTFSATATDPTLTDVHLSYLDTSNTATDIKDCPNSAPSTSATCSGTISPAIGWTPGTYTLVATATDGAGHTVTKQKTFKIDGNPPTVTISSIPAQPVLRNADATVVVTASDAETSVATVTLSVVGGAAGGTDLAVPMTTSSGTAYTFTVNGRAGPTTPVLAATRKSYGVVATATDAWGNQKSTPASQLVITRIYWHTNLAGSNGNAVAALSPAVAPDGTVYVVSQGTTDTLMTLDAATGAAAKFAVPAHAVIKGPMLEESASGLVHVLLLEEVSASSGKGQIEAFNPDKSQAWVYPANGSGNSALDLPGLGTSGNLYVPMNVPPLVITANQVCVDDVVSSTGNLSTSACQPISAWTRAGTAVLRRAGSDLVVARSTDGTTMLVQCGAGRCSLLASGSPAGQSVGGPTAAGTRFYVVGVPASGTGSAGTAMGFPWGTTGLASTDAGWTESLVGPTTGVRSHAGALAGGLDNELWFASAADPTTYQTVTLPTAGGVTSLSVGTQGRTYAEVDTGSSAYVIAYGPPPSTNRLWRFPGPNQVATLPQPAPGTTAVLGPNGILIVPDGQGGVTALITDSLTQTTGWTDARSGPSRSASVAGN